VNDYQLRFARHHLIVALDAMRAGSTPFFSSKLMALPISGPAKAAIVFAYYEAQQGGEGLPEREGKGEAAMETTAETGA
jgi:hypothetical protein